MQMGSLQYSMLYKEELTGIGFPLLLFVAFSSLLSQIQRVCIADVVMDETAAGH